MTMAAADLQRQCNHLLRQLKTNQASLWQGLPGGAMNSSSSSSAAAVAAASSSRTSSSAAAAAASLDANLQAYLSDRKPEYARQKLKSIIKTSTKGDNCRSTGLGSGRDPHTSQSPESLQSESPDAASPPRKELQKKKGLGGFLQGEDHSQFRAGAEDYYRSSSKTKRAAEKDLVSASRDKTAKPKLVQGENGGGSKNKADVDTDPMLDYFHCKRAESKDAADDADAIQDYFQSRASSDSLMEGGTGSFCSSAGRIYSCNNDTDDDATTTHTKTHQRQDGDYNDNNANDKPSTPASVRRRRIIDRNVHVDSAKLSDWDLAELERDSRGLNFSYSQNLDEGHDIDDDHDDVVDEGQDDNVIVRGGGRGKKRDDDDDVGGGRNDDDDDEDVGGGRRGRNGKRRVDDGGDGGAREARGEEVEEGERSEAVTYQRKLVDRGNNRQLNNFIRDTTIKPRTVLNSTLPMPVSSFSKQGPGVSFNNSTSSSAAGGGSNTSGASSLFRSQARERRLLGYDWIAALIGNSDMGLMDESESYFHELREFRRHNRDECCNDFYMEGPFTLTDTEPAAVEEAIKDTKVQPYTVNERLFTVPVTENLLGQPLDPEAKAQGSSAAAKPTQDNPRFVRVSIPRATLQLPYKVKAHRRRSFDSSDSCSLMDHCLLGWNAVSPATLPTASSVALSDAMTGVNPKHTTTLAEAEKAAAMHHWPLLTDPSPHVQPPAPQRDLMSTWRKQYMDSTQNLLQPSGLDSTSLSLSASLNTTGSSMARQRHHDATRDGQGQQRRTDELLNSTYAMMYHMQTTREARKQEEREWRTSAKASS